jgi:hypothetical protein
MGEGWEGGSCRAGGGNDFAHPGRIDHPIVIVEAKKPRRFDDGSAEAAPAPGRSRKQEREVELLRGWTAAAIVHELSPPASVGTSSDLKP